jgi:dTMP kinase
MAARVDHVRKRILPALRAGQVVLCDRFRDSTMAYQGMARGLGEEFIDFLHEYALDDLKPHLTFLLDIAPEEGLARASARRHAETRFEQMDLDFHRRIREAFLTLSAREPQRIAVIDAARDKQAVHRDIMHLWQQRTKTTP